MKRKVTAIFIMFFFTIAFMLSINSVYAEDFPNQSLPVGKYTVSIASGFPLQINEAYVDSDYNTTYECTTYPCTVWRYYYEGDYSKISHLLHGITYSALREAIGVVGGGGAVSEPYEGDTATNWGEGIGVNVITLNPQPSPIDPNTATAWFATDKGSVGESYCAVETGKSINTALDSIVGPGYDVPSFELYQKVENVYFEGHRFVLIRTAYSKCPVKVYHCGTDFTSDYTKCDPLTPVDISTVIQSTDTNDPELGRFVGVADDECKPVYFQLGDNTRRVVCSGSVCYVVYY